MTVHVGNISLIWAICLDPDQGSGGFPEHEQSRTQSPEGPGGADSATIMVRGDPTYVYNTNIGLTIRCSFGTTDKQTGFH